jgi:hypothetical protein
MPIEPPIKSKILTLFLELSQYPILAPTIRARMREELFARGIITRENFENEARAKAQRSQELEGLTDPLTQEPAEVWERRLQQMRDTLTDFYFAYNLPHDLFKDIVQSVIAQRNPNQKVILTFHPELAPIDMVIAQGEQYEKLPEAERREVEHHYREMLVVLLKAIVSDQLAFVRVAKEYFTIKDIVEIRKRRIGEGKIGGKAAGMLLAWKILQAHALEDGIDPQDIVIPESYYIGANGLYDFNVQNGLLFSVDQKYKPREAIEAEYPGILQAYLDAQIPDEIKNRLYLLLAEIGNCPLIVRSSSLLEDSFGTSFAGKYESFFLPNQRSVEENLEDLTTAIKHIYASVLSPDALIYRQRMGLVDYDERMAILIQLVQGTQHGTYFYPTLAGVGYSRNPFRWNPKIRREDGFLRLVWGLGTRAVEHLDNDFPRLVALSHPHLRPETTAHDIRRHSQRFVDVIDLEENQFVTQPVTSIMSYDDPALPYLVSEDKEDFLQPLFTDPRLVSKDKLVLTMDGVLARTSFATIMKRILQRLERTYAFPVDIEFTADILPREALSPRVVVHLLQCRPHMQYESNQAIAIPRDVRPADKIFFVRGLVQPGVVSDIEYVVYISPERYSQIAHPTTKLELARLVGRLNKRLDGKTFILMGPGRWGSVNPELGLAVTYADINNTRALVEIAMPHSESASAVSYGTHFFQDLVEARIYPVPLFPNDRDTLFNRAFFENAPNALATLLPNDAEYAEYVKVIDVPAFTHGRFLHLVMNDETGEALAYLK